VELSARAFLVVDDDPGMLRKIKRLLLQHDYEPILFSSAQDFKSHTDFEKAACVILDINLNDGSGIELRHGLHDAGISVPVIFMTGNEDPAVRRDRRISRIRLSDKTSRWWPPAASRF
jgi:FixJ family two-component response regulator